jgi:hypothetical protein
MYLLILYYLFPYFTYLLIGAFLINLYKTHVLECDAVQSDRVHRRFGVACGLNLEGRRESEANNQYLALKIQEVYSSETSVNFYRAIRCRVSEENIHLFVFSCIYISGPYFYE